MEAPAPGHCGTFALCSRTDLREALNRWFTPHSQILVFFFFSWLFPTQELEKLASRKLKINAKETMRIAEKLYTQG